MTTATQKIPARYKQTEIGMIPEDWEVKRIGDCLLKRPEYGINAPAVPYSDNLPVYIRITDISEEGKFLPEKISSVNRPDSKEYLLEKDDLVFARTGASVGKTYLYKQSDGELVFAGFLIRVKPNPNKLNPQYLKSFTETTSYWNWVKVMSMRSGQPGINGNEYSQLPIPLPPTRAEQTAIATALADADELITALDKLITKKHNIKQGAMQELLTGKKRLPGFSGKWEEKKLGEIGKFRGGSGFPTKYQGGAEGLYPFFKVSDMNNKGNQTFMINANNWIGENIRKQIGANTFPKHTIIVAKIGAAIFLERKKVLSRESCIDNNMMGFIFDEKAAAYKFIHYLFLNIQLGKFVSTTALPSLNGKELAELRFRVPKIDEQTAIAQVLSDMDTEIDELEQKLDKYKMIKQGMMQELLTGKTRLV